MALTEPEVPTWPVAEASVAADGSARLTIHNTERPVDAADPDAARAEVRELVRRELARELGRPVRLRTFDPDGTEGLIAVAPDGNVTERSRTRPRDRLSPTPPAAPSTLHVAEPDHPTPAAAAGELSAPPVELDIDAARAPRPIRRSEVHHRPPGPLQRAWAWVTGELLVSGAERAERAEDGRFAKLVGASYSNVIPFVGPRGGAGKTTAARTVGGILAGANCGSVVLFDADQHYGPARRSRP
jgi:hypothetical protein